MDKKIQTIKQYVLDIGNFISHADLSADDLHELTDQAIQLILDIQKLEQNLKIKGVKDEI